MNAQKMGQGNMIAKQKNRKIGWLVALLVFTPLLAQADIYSCRDAQGIITLRNSPCEKNEAVNSRTFTEPAVVHRREPKLRKRSPEERGEPPTYGSADAQLKAKQAVKKQMVQQLHDVGEQVMQEPEVLRSMLKFNADPHVRALLSDPFMVKALKEGDSRYLQNSYDYRMLLKSYPDAVPALKNLATNGQ